MVRVERPPRPSALSNALVFGWRAALKFKHVPEQLFDLVMTPIMFTLLFVYVFGGAIKTPGFSYVDFLIPGIIVQNIAFGGFVTAVGLIEHLNRGLIDRFRSLPMSRSGVRRRACGTGSPAGGTGSPTGTGGRSPAWTSGC